MTSIVDDAGQIREVRRVIDNDLSGGEHSPKQQVNLKVDGGGIALALSLVALGGVLVAVILLPQVMRAQAEAAAAPAKAQASYAERDARVALDYVTSVQSSLEKNGISIKPPSGH